MTVPPNVKYQDLFLKLQREAMEGKRGMWSCVDRGCREMKGMPPEEKADQECVFVSSRVSNVFHKPDCEWAGKIKPWNRQCFSSREKALEEGKKPCKVCKP